MKGHEPPTHVLTNDLEAQLQNLSVRGCFVELSMPVMGTAYLLGMYRGASWIASYQGGDEANSWVLSNPGPCSDLSPVWENRECLRCNISCSIKR